jgi:4-amino-4-deoxy-L-arabinose transferase-like glycosyltransferase
VFRNFVSVPFSFNEALAAAFFIVLALFFIVTQGVRFGGGLALPLFVGLGSRLALSTANRFFRIAPDGGSDAVRFERVAWDWAQSGCGNMSQYFEPTGSYLISWVYGQMYACIGRVPLAAHYINVFLGVVIICYVAKLVDKLWGREIAIRAAWIAAVFPALIVYSSVTFREPFFALGILLGVYWLVLWLREQRIILFFWALMSFSVATMFHGGGVFAIVGVLIFLLTAAFRRVLAPSRFVRRSTFLAGCVALLTLAFVFIASPEIRVNKLGDITEIGTERVEELLEDAGAEMRGRSHYPAFLVGGTGATLIWQTPLRMVYLQFGPFLWDIRAPNHILGLVDGCFYIIAAFLLWRYRTLWWGKPEFMIVLTILLSLLLVYGWGTSNFGTGFRHRTKFAALFISIAAGVIGSKTWRARVHSTNNGSS